jgi:hypothetical protein
VRSTAARLEGYLFTLATHLDRIGATGIGPLALTRGASGALLFDLRAVMPSGAEAAPSRLRIGERWDAIDAGFERSSYVYELVDLHRGRRRAFHRHHTRVLKAPSASDFHAHCEESIGQPICRHYHGRPVRDGYEAIRMLLIAWTESEPLGCDQLDCIEAA